MDDKWFKQQQKRVGVTAEDIAARLGRSRSNVSHILNGKQRMSLEWAKAFADVLQVPIATVLEKSGAANSETAQRVSPGFAEAEAAPWSGQGAEHDRNRRIAEMMGARSGVDLWSVRGNGMLLGGYRSGDFILVDTHASERARRGDDVIAQIYRHGGARTVFRRFEPPVLLPLSPDPDELTVMVVDNDTVVIRGKVVASWRG